MKRDNSKDPLPCAVYCHASCGLVFFDREEEKRQLRQPNRAWVCPQCDENATWDDYCQTTNPPEEE